MSIENVTMLPAFRPAKRCNSLPLDLQWFGEGGGGEGPGTAAGAASAAEQGAGDAPSETASGNTAGSAEPDKRAAFERLIRGEYKEEFARRTQSILDKRFRQAKALEEKYRESDRLLAAMARHYGVDPADCAAIARAAGVPYGQDGQMDEPAADARSGQTPDLRARLLAARREQAVRATWEAWRREGAEMKQTYPDFDLAAELKDPDFARLLKGGVSLRAAYQARHLDRILGGAMQYAAQRAAQGTAARMADRARRPAENGTLSHAGAIFKTDVAKLTRAQREEIERRAARGEQILL